MPVSLEEITWELASEDLLYNVWIGILLTIGPGGSFVRGPNEAKSAFACPGSKLHAFFGRGLAGFGTFATYVRSAVALIKVCLAFN